MLTRFGRTLSLVALTVLCVVVLAGTVASAHKRRMHEVLPRDSFTRAMMSIGISVSKLAHGAEGYVLYLPVISALQENGFNAEKMSMPGQLDFAIQAASSIELPASDQRRAIVVRDWGDDKGYSDFTTLAFVTFGPNLASLFWLYFSLLSATCLFYIIRYRRDGPALFLLLVALVAHRLVVDILPNSTVSAVVHDARFLPAISTVAALHLALTPLRPGAGDRLSLMLTLVQALVMVFVFNARSSAIWQAMFVFAVVGAAAGYRLWRVRRAAREIVSHVVVALSVVAGIAGVHIYKAQNYSEIYKSDGTLNHVFWHNVYMGLGIHPDAERRFGLIPDDSTSYKHAQEFLASRPGAMSELGIRKEDIRYPLFETVGWRKYDQVVGVMFRDFVERNQRYVLESYFLYKPAYVVDQILWQIGMKAEFPNWISLNPVHKPAGSERMRIAGLGAILVLLVGAALLYKVDRAFLSIGLAIVPVVLFVFSLLPSFVVAPFYYELPVMFMAFAIALYSIAISGSARLVRAITLRRALS